MAEARLSYEAVELNGLLGTLKMAADGLGWKARAEGEKIIAVPAAELKSMRWLRATRGYRLRVQMQNGTVLRLDGFDEGAKEDLDRFVKRHYNLSLDSKEVGVKGWNWGDTDIQGTTLSFLVNKREAFEIPLNEVSSTTVIGKTDVNLVFQPGAGGKRDDEFLTELRFFVPNKGGETEAEGDQVPAVVRAAVGPAVLAITPRLAFLDTLNQAIKANIDLDKVTGESLVTFNDLQCIYPRGRYEVDFYEDFLRLRGKSHDYKIKFEHVKRLYQLPKENEPNNYFVVALDPPIRQGLTRYNFLVFQIPQDDDLALTVKLTEQEIATKYRSEFKRRYEKAALTTVVGDIFKGFTGAKLVEASSQFASAQNTKSLRCAVKADQGLLYPLDKEFLFTPKPVIFIRYKDVTEIELSQLDKTVRSFEVDITTKQGSYKFTQFAKENYDLFAMFCRKMNLNVKSQKASDKRKTYAEVDDDDEDGEDGDDDNSGGGDDDDDDESGRTEALLTEDDDFAPKEESDVEEEFDEDYQSPDEDGAAAAAPSKKGEKKRKAADKGAEGAAAKKAKPSKEPSKAAKPKLAKTKTTDPAGKSGKGKAKAGSADDGKRKMADTVDDEDDD